MRVTASERKPFECFLSAFIDIVWSHGSAIGRIRPWFICVLSKYNPAHRCLQYCLILLTKFERICSCLKRLRVASVLEVNVTRNVAEGAQIDDRIIVEKDLGGGDVKSCGICAVYYWFRLCILR